MGAASGPHLTAAWELAVGAGSDTKGHTFLSSRSSTASWWPRRVRGGTPGMGPGSGVPPTGYSGAKILADRNQHLYQLPLGDPGV